MYYNIVSSIGQYRYKNFFLFVNPIYLYCCFAAPVLCLEIFLYSSKHGLLDIKALLLLLDHKTLSETLDKSTRKTHNTIKVRYFMNLVARRCKVSYLLHQYINYYISVYM